LILHTVCAYISTDNVWWFQLISRWRLITNIHVCTLWCTCCACVCVIQNKRIECRMSMSYLLITTVLQSTTSKCWNWVPFAVKQNVLKTIIVIWKFLTITVVETTLYYYVWTAVNYSVLSNAKLPDELSFKIYGLLVHTAIQLWIVIAWLIINDFMF